MVRVTQRKTDSIRRRLRFAAPAPSGKQIVINEADICVFEAINRHGPLPTHYLFEFQRHLRKEYTNFQYRLTQFYNGDLGGPYLMRPPQQFSGFEARYQHVVYDLAPRARAILETQSMVRPPRSDPFLHRLMGACVGASIELTATAKGLRYIGRDEILSRHLANGGDGQGPASTDPLAISVAGARLVPDDLFGIQYPGVGFRFFAVEIDRKTESIERRCPDQTAFGRKVERYLAILHDRSFHTWWGVPNLSILVVTTNRTHGANILRYITRQNDPRFENRFAVASLPQFGANWRVPKTILTHLLDEPWSTSTGSKDLSQAYASGDVHS